MANQKNTRQETHASSPAEVPVRQRTTRLPIVSLGAEYLVMGHLMRRNILAYKAPPNNEGYDLICIHPDCRKSGKHIRVQVKSRFATDCDGAFPLRSQGLDAFDYVVLVLMNIGYYLFKAKSHETRDGELPPVMYVLPSAIVEKHYQSAGGWGGKVQTRGHDLSKYEGPKGIEMIARDLKIPYPEKVGVVGPEDIG